MNWIQRADELGLLSKEERLDGEELDVHRYRALSFGAGDGIGGGEEANGM